MRETIRVEVNGETYEREVEPRMLLVHFLREALALTGNTEDVDKADQQRPGHTHGYPGSVNIPVRDRPQCPRRPRPSISLPEAIPGNIWCSSS